MFEHIIESNKIESVFDDKEHLRSYLAWQWLIKQDKPNLAVVLELHKRIMSKHLGKEAGKLRTMSVTVGGRVCPDPFLVPYLLANWLLDMQSYNATDGQARTMHVRFEKIHPFVDGNGRTGRMLMWWHQKRLAQHPTYIFYEPVGAYSSRRKIGQQEYYGWFK